MEVSDGYVFAAGLDNRNLHLIKVSPNGQLQWLTPLSLSVAGTTTHGIATQTYLQKLLRYRGDTLLICGMSALNTALYLIEPSGKVAVQRFYKDSVILHTQDYCTANGRVYVVGWRGSQTFVLGTQGDMHLVCNDTVPDPQVNVLGRISIRKEPLATVESIAVIQQAFSASGVALGLPAVAYLCLTNDTTGAEEVVSIQRPTCLGEVVYLRPDAPKGATITWPDGQQDTLWRVEGPGTYTAVVEYCGLQWKVEYRLEAQDCHCKPIYPNAFTPDGDGINDAFGPIDVPECAYRAFEWSVFNRWGQRIFEANSPHSTWDGRLPNGQVAPSDVYVWQLRYALPNGNDTVWFVQKGDVTLLR